MKIAAYVLLAFALTACAVRPVKQEQQAPAAVEMHWIADEACPSTATHQQCQKYQAIQPWVKEAERTSVKGHYLQRPQRK